MRTDGPVVIALDGSPHSELTLQWGLAEAQRRDARVVLARAYQEPREITQWSWYPVFEDLDFSTEAKEYLEERAERAAAQHPGLRLETALLHGSEVPQLRTLSEDAQLLVLGARGQSVRRHIGRVSAHLAAHARCPVAVVRADHPVAPDAPVVVGVDGSRTSVAAARVAAREAGLLGVGLVVTHARPTYPDPYGTGGTGGTGGPVVVTDETDPAHRAAASVAEDLRAAHPGLDVRLHMVDDEPVHALVEAARDARLLVVGSRGLGAFQGMLLGAVSSDVVRTARTSVLVVHEVEAA
ncbi:universal stress protein [Cellulomonas cellasea]|uniref:Nucleotide-binding universal stress UspA family protein n=1 Tax=Cellulomonas cellasea TaxID=43670 RepID=A0A7W4UD84_9CELL|nr:universal stress protein [Cellulomonas cellasea]MBB2921679.1 nucleotide-binding universal stress UspA family protein [Cellulomonas cellasea]